MVRALDLTEDRRLGVAPPEGGSVLLLEKVHSEAARLFHDAGFDVESVPESLPEDELVVRIPGVSVLGIRSKTQVTRRVVEAADALQAVGAFCIGTNQIDLEACREKGVPVFNAPFSNTRSVVELALGEIIVLFRNVVEKSWLLHDGIWNKSAHRSREVRGKRLGIVGYGNIGAQLSVLAEALGMEVHFYDVADKLALGNAHRAPSLKALLEISDVVTIHVDGSPSNAGLMGKREFRWMKDGAVFINLSRGFVVDLPALKDALNSGKVRAAAVDVFPQEPGGNEEPFSSELQGYRNVILTPHIGGSTEEAQEDIGRFVPGKVLDYLRQGNTRLSVNFPGLQLPERRGAHRVVHIHENVPGILARINQVLAEAEANITGQYLKTGEGIGYVITDVDGQCPPEVLQALWEIPRTIRVKLLY
ncbi:MAG: phosphoglycerate dehydrogenase [Gemmatimonadota bacterium]